MYFICKEHLNILLKNSLAKGITDVIHTLTQRLFRRNAPGDAKSGFVKVLIIVHFMDSFKIRFAHAKHSKVSEYNITILNLMLRPVGCHIHAVEFFDEIAFSKEGTHNSQTAGWDNAFICKLNNNVLIGVQCDSVVVIHGKRLQSIGFVTSIVPYIFFTWWVNNDIEQQSIAKA